MVGRVLENTGISLEEPKQVLKALTMETMEMQLLLQMLP